jgi:hypothetical protein
MLSAKLSITWVFVNVLRDMLATPVTLFVAVSLKKFLAGSTMTVHLAPFVMVVIAEVNI